VNGWLVSYEYGSGAAWGVVRASSTDDIRRLAPDVVVHTDAPSWMSTAELTCFREQSVELHDLSADRLFEVSRTVGAALAN
jgi:hypothetical protein